MSNQLYTIMQEIDEFLTPQQIVAALDKYIIGQHEAKRTLAIALRERWRRKNVYTGIREEINPTRILMEGPTGSGKTELGRRLAKLNKVPFIKVEATQYTERGYIGDDVQKMIVNLAELALDIVREEREEQISEQIEERVDQIILDVLIPPISKQSEQDGETNEDNEKTRAVFLKRIKEGKIDDKPIEIEVKEKKPGVGFIGAGMVDESMVNFFSNMMNRMMPTRTRRIRVTIEEAKRILMEEQLEREIDMQSLREEAIERAEEGIVFIDEIDKIVGTRISHGPDVSREGVQRNLLPLVEGTTVNTKIGPVSTENILFIAAGAFHSSKPSDLMPEFQGRFPARVKLQELTEDDYAHILRLPKNALTKQQEALLATEGVKLRFTSNGVRAIAQAASFLNKEKENIGARRLRALMSKVLENVLFDVPENIKPGSTVTIDKAFVEKNLQELLKERQNKEYIL